MSTSPSNSASLLSLFEDLTGSWTLSRSLRSADPAEPSGRCSGTAVLTKRPSPSPVVDSEGILNVAVAELLYHEHGEFEMMKATGNNLINTPTFTFSRKYIWRLQKAGNGHIISIWFTKPGTGTIDYLFHKIDIASAQDQAPASNGRLVFNGTGGHLCVEDFYSSSYAFTLCQTSDNSPVSLSSWTTLHEVRGPKKDQRIKTTFVKP